MDFVVYYLSKVGWSESAGASSRDSEMLLLYKLEWLMLCDILLDPRVPVAAVE